MQRKEWLFVFH